MNTTAIKKLIPLRLKKHLVTYMGARDFPLPSSNRCFIFLAADYGNIGDIAISYAQKQYLQHVMTNYEVVSVPISQTRLVLNSIKQRIQQRDIVTIIGGGNMGSSYPDIEELRQLVINTFPTNRVVCFPQTLDWSDSAKSKRALHRIVKVYAKHPDIHIFARESMTAAKLTKLFAEYSNVHVGLVPDIVMSANAAVLGTTNDIESSTILRCLRDDKEAALSTEQYGFIDKALADTGYQIEKTDTHAGGSQLDEAHCKKLLTDKLSQFRAAKLVVTDRLHGMILCLLSGTPCLVLPNSNHKIRQTQLDWLRNHPRLVFLELDEVAEISKHIDKLLSLSHGTMNESPVHINEYHELEKSVVMI
ncbi:polysaccharide pyruvyl transferase family protein [Psychrobacter sp. 28M-43]|uniref:polysaccharide pyruvyl transferase family protein n=1 Tax=Psychrobacter sp. 28M-43 TaxID=2772254 RepID=UPI00168D944F|nr:polysaccharide pyruvyl transferase family protein [Psychrobacter sp. 28M-43]QOD13351.1 polysaccharide pyruvyl transferase family protein [Psychrobacter sp. 28M-43]